MPKIKICTTTLEQALKEIEAIVNGHEIRTCIEIEYLQQRTLKEVLSQ